jgi:alpha-galactosidase
MKPPNEEKILNIFKVHLEASINKAHQLVILSDTINWKVSCNSTIHNRIFKMKKKIFLSIIFFGYLLFAADKPKLENEILTFEYNDQLHSRIESKLPDSEKLMNDFATSESLILTDQIIVDFKLVDSKVMEDEKSFGLTLTGESSIGKIQIRKEVGTRIQKQFPDFIITRVKYTNTGKSDLMIVGWTNNSYSILPAKNITPTFWSFQGASYDDRRDWIQPINNGFNQENYMGMNASDYGGGTPVCDIWRPDLGIAVGHLEPSPKLVSIPVSYNSADSGANIYITYKFLEPKKLLPGESFETFETFIAIHKKDYFHTLQSFSKIMEEKGLSFEEFSPATYESEWCAWGYERNFTIDEILGTLPKVSEMGYDWATLDDGWQTAEGDWFLNPKRFPNGDSDMKTFVDEIHKYNLKAMLWWAPLAVDPETDLIKNHSDYLLLNKDGSTQSITWWDSYYLCPAYEPVIEYHKDLVKKIMSEWGYEGLKIDGQHLNAAPPCYNQAHHHSYPEESSEKMPEFFKAIFETALSIDSNAVVQICPCGTSYSFYNLPYMNQTVASDPTSSWQIRLKGKTLKALMGSNSPYFGDHVELSNDKSDFASTIGVGGIVGTKFTYPTDRLEHKDHLLTGEKENTWKKWLDIYNNNLLSKADYRGELYDIGYDKPETHVIQKGDILYYAFYSPKWNGEIELRGLENKDYKIIDYVNDKFISDVKGMNPKIKVDFSGYLLIKVLPEN